MARLSHSIARLSIGAKLIALAGAAGLAFAAGAGLAEAPRPAAAPATGAPTAADARSPYFGRWTVSGGDQVFSSRGKLYKTIDIAPCGRDFCGISVGADGTCGATLFRFFSRNRNAEVLRGHGVWGKARKNVVVQNYTSDELPGGRGIDINLGDGHDFGERSENMPKFTASYQAAGSARCTTG